MPEAGQPSDKHERSLEERERSSNRSTRLGARSRCHRLRDRRCAFRSGSDRHSDRGCRPVQTAFPARAPGFSARCSAGGPHRLQLSRVGAGPVSCSPSSEVALSDRISGRAAGEGSPQTAGAKAISVALGVGCEGEKEVLGRCIEQSGGEIPLAFGPWEAARRSCRVQRRSAGCGRQRQRWHGRRRLKPSKASAI
jgi:hypothetical protein